MDLSQKRRCCGTQITGDRGDRSTIKRKKIHLQQFNAINLAGNSTESKRIEVSCEEHDRILEALRLVDWDSVKNTSRRNVIDPKNALRTNSGRLYCQSFILGPNMKSPTLEPSYWTTAYPELLKLLTYLMKKHDPEHKWSNITVNRNSKCKPHRDSGNKGASYIVGFGNYSGGELSIERLGTSERRVDKRDICRKFVRFFGGEQTHWTEPFKGERYSCVFYNFPDIHKKAKLQCQKESIEQLKTDEIVSTTSESDFVAKLSRYKRKLNKR